MKLGLLIFSLSRVFKYSYNSIDTYIEGRWREYPPFSFIDHPHPDAHSTFEDICNNADYNVSAHLVTTEDGYINKVFRINKKHWVKPKSTPAVIFVHGLIDSSNTWIVNEKNKSSPFIAAEEGYDVWVVNTRGNKHSK